MASAEGEAVPFPLPLFSFLEGEGGGALRSPRLRARRNGVRAVVSLANQSVRLLNALSVGRISGGEASEVCVERERLREFSKSRGGLGGVVALRDLWPDAPASFLCNVSGWVGLPVSTGRVQLRFLLSVFERVRAHHVRFRAGSCLPSRTARNRARSGGFFSQQTSTQAEAWDDTLPFGSLFEYASRGCVVPLVADRVSLPVKAGTVDLVSALPAGLQETYGSAEAMLGEGKGGSGRRRGLRQDAKEYRRLVSRMAKAGMVVFVPEADFLSGGGVVNGIFCVAKSASCDRLIVNMKPANARMVLPPKTKLTTPDLLTRLIVKPGESLFVAKSDLSDFYHALRTPEWMRPFSGMPAVEGEGLEGGPGPGRYVPCGTTMQMGWSHAVHAGQAAHLEFISRHTLLSLGDQICEGNDFRVDRVRWLLYIDDLILFVPAGSLAEGERVFKSYLDAVERSGFLLKPSKVVHFTQRDVDVLGFRVNGRNLTIVPVPEKLSALMIVTRTMCRRGRATGAELARILGQWTWVMLLRRPAFSVFARVYWLTHLALGRCGGQVPVDLWACVVAEFRAALAMAPLLCASLRSRWAPEMYASDASKSGVGVVTVRAVPAVCEEVLANHGVSPSGLAHSRLLNLSKQWSVLRWRTRVSARWRPRAAQLHINNLEFAALIMSVRRSAQSPLGVSASLAALVDSSVVLGAARKGRSSKFRRECRTLAAFLMGGDVRLVLAWISTLFNPADKPSRF
jgi:hypothetical protein